MLFKIRKRLSIIRLFLIFTIYLLSFFFNIYATSVDLVLRVFSNFSEDAPYFDVSAAMALLTTRLLYIAF